MKKSKLKYENNKLDTYLKIAILVGILSGFITKFIESKLPKPFRVVTFEDKNLVFLLFVLSLLMLIGLISFSLLVFYKLFIPVGPAIAYGPGGPLALKKGDKFEPFPQKKKDIDTKHREIKAKQSKDRKLLDRITYHKLR